MDPQTVFADALARARQIAAKIGGDRDSTKRPYDGADDFPDSKKMASNDIMSAQMRSQAAQAAASAAAQINAKLGLANNIPPNPMGNMGNMSNMSNMGGMPGMGGGSGFTATEIIEVPDKMVGLVIGKGGEHITTIQAATGVKIQFAPDSGGKPNRQCTLSGPREGIGKAKSMVQDIIARGHALPPSESFKPDMGSGGTTTVEMFVPGPRVGLVIGKNGEMIKQIQEKCGVKMVMIQDSNKPSESDKPLRITGDPMKCQRAKEMVMDLLTQKEVEVSSFVGGGGNEYGASKKGFEMPVPRAFVGVVIGRNGEIIKRITAETGAKVQFKQDDGTGPDRMCSITGNPEGIQRAAQMVRELIQNAARQDGGRTNGSGGPFGGMGAHGPGGGFGGAAQETTYSIPADKCGLVIGKGGETIRDINRLSGAFVELSRTNNPSSPQRVFNIKGSPDQVQEAVRLICEKAGLPPPTPNPQNKPFDHFGGPQFGGQPFGQPGMPQGQPMQGFPNWGGPFQPQQQQQQPQQQQQQQPWAPPTPNDPMKQQQQPQQPPGVGVPAQDPNAAAWAAYYQQLYGQQQPVVMPQQSQPQQPVVMPQQQQQPQMVVQQPGATPQQGFSYPSPTVNPMTGQLDYSQAWAEYYRQQGLYQQAQAITQQQQQLGAGPQPGGPQPGPPMSR